MDQGMQHQKRRNAKIYETFQQHKQKKKHLARILLFWPAFFSGKNALLYCVRASHMPFDCIFYIQYSFSFFFSFY